jgi:hypothetical protein
MCFWSFETSSFEISLFSSFAHFFTGSLILRGREFSFYEFPEYSGY